MKEGYKVKKADIGYAVSYKDRYDRESIWITCHLKENAKEICDILNKDSRGKVCKPQRKCQTCTNRFICPTFKENECCDGYNDEQVFNGLLKMLFGGMANEHIDSMLERCKIIQGRKK